MQATAEWRVCRARDCRWHGAPQPVSEFVPERGAGTTRTCRSCRKAWSIRLKRRRERERERRDGRKASRQGYEVLRLRNRLRRTRQLLRSERNARAALAREVERLHQRLHAAGVADAGC